MVEVSEVLVPPVLDFEFCCTELLVSGSFIQVNVSNFRHKRWENKGTFYSKAPSRHLASHDKAMTAEAGLRQEVSRVYVITVQRAHLKHKNPRNPE